jgi:hypothetical protein
LHQNIWQHVFGKMAHKRPWVGQVELAMLASRDHDTAYALRDRRRV